MCVLTALTIPQPKEWTDCRTKGYRFRIENYVSAENFRIVLKDGSSDTQPAVFQLTQDDFSCRDYRRLRKNMGRFCVLKEQGGATVPKTPLPPAGPS